MLFSADAGRCIFFDTYNRDEGNDESYPTSGLQSWFLRNKFISQRIIESIVNVYILCSSVIC